MRILVTGCEGQLGAELSESLQRVGTVIAVGRAAMNLANLREVERTLNAVSPDLIVNAAGYTAVDQAETEPAVAMMVNAEAPGLMARYAERNAAVLVHFSTDYVFDGQAGRPYVEADAPHPLMVYGRSKLAGEHQIRDTAAACLIFRTSWVYSYRRTNFVTKIAELFQQRDEVAVVDDQRGAPTYAPHLAVAVTEVLARYSPSDLHRIASDHFGGVFHLAGGGETTWYGLASEAMALISASTLGNRVRACRLRPIRSSEYPSPVCRPTDSRLDCSAAARRLGISLPPWRDGLRDCVRRITTVRR